jgi:hypothetical protein
VLPRLASSALWPTAGGHGQGLATACGIRGHRAAEQLANSSGSTLTHVAGRGKPELGADLGGDLTAIAHDQICPSFETR